MAYLALGCAALALILWLSGGRRVLKRREWRLLSGAFALAAFTGAAYAGARGAIAPAIVLVVIGLWLGVSVRRTGLGSGPSPNGARMSLRDARALLGVGSDASREDIQAAYARLMRMAHPDRGGTDGLAAQLNAARDRLLKG